jgi:hypothetical protein
MSASLLPFLHGALTLACLAVGVKFLKYYQLSRDRFFVWFAVAFFTFATGVILRVFVVRTIEHSHLLFLPRVIGFSLIIVAIVDKNRHHKP